MSNFPRDTPQSQALHHVYGDNHISEDPSLSSLGSRSGSSETHFSSLLYRFSLLKDKVHQFQSLLGIFVSPAQPSQSASLAISSAGTLLQEIIITASSMMFTCQQISLGATQGNSSTAHVNRFPSEGLPNPSYVEPIDWYGDSYNTCNASNNTSETRSLRETSSQVVENGERLTLSPKSYDIIEMDAADLLAKYTHYCQICGKGFKRDANLRMHMRAHGDEYKSSAALSNPTKKTSMEASRDDAKKAAKKYSCPQEGCRWNKKHPKFQPLKSMICVKNHYKRSHCPKMYVCKRCNRKQFSVLSDLRTHEKHCGNLKWLCSCGTTFSRKDKLMGHVALFVGHAPALTNSLNRVGTVDQCGLKIDNKAKIL